MGETYSNKEDKKNKIRQLGGKRQDSRNTNTKSRGKKRKEKKGPKDIQKKNKMNGSKW